MSEDSFDDLLSAREPGAKATTGIFVSVASVNSAAFELEAAKLESLAALQRSFGYSGTGRDVYGEVVEWSLDQPEFYDADGNVERSGPPVVYDQNSPEDVERREIERQLMDALDGEWERRIDFASELGPTAVMADYLKACAAAGLPPRPLT